MEGDNAGKTLDFARELESLSAQLPKGPDVNILLI